MYIYNNSSFQGKRKGLSWSWSYGS